MRHSNRNKKFGRVRKTRRALLRSLAHSLLRDTRIATTEAKAKALRPFAERLVTLAKRGTPAAFRILRARLGTVAARQIRLGELAAQYSARRGGYTRVTKTGRRASDGAKMAVIELV